jgi:hypothetical protein
VKAKENTKSIKFLFLWKFHGKSDILECGYLLQKVFTGDKSYTPYNWVLGKIIMNIQSNVLASIVIA